MERRAVTGSSSFPAGTIVIIVTLDRDDERKKLLDALHMEIK